LTQHGAEACPDPGGAREANMGDPGEGLPPSPTIDRCMTDVLLGVFSNP
jgi:hypothetical protein